MTNIIITVMLFLSSLFMEEPIQAPVADNTKQKVEINSISVAANSEELKNIDWKELESILVHNPSDKKIALNFELKSGEFKHAVKNSFMIKGATEDIEKIILEAQKGVQSLVLIKENHKIKA